MAAVAVRFFAGPPAHPNRPLPAPRASSSKPAEAQRVAFAAAAAVFAGGAAMALAAAPSHALTSSLSILPEPANALSLPTWAIHVSSVVEWVLAMALVWDYGEKSGFQQWKGLSWGMVPLLGGAMCACTWHFFYNSESLEILVAIQAALTVVGNITMAIAAFRIYEASQKGPSSS